MLACLTGKVKANPLASLSSASSFLPVAATSEANVKCKYNLTEVGSDGQRYQEQANHPLEHGGVVEVDSLVYAGRGCEQGEYLLPAPGPRLLILVNFTRIHTAADSSSGNNGTVSDYNNHRNTTTKNTYYNNNTLVNSTGHRSDDLSARIKPISDPVHNTTYEHISDTTPLSDLDRPIGRSRSGSHEPDSRGGGLDNRSADMLAVGDARRQRLHHSEGDQRKQQQRLHHLTQVTGVPGTSGTTATHSQRGQAPAQSSTADTAAANVHTKSTFQEKVQPLETSASVADSEKNRIQWPKIVSGVVADDRLGKKSRSSPKVSLSSHQNRSEDSRFPLLPESDSVHHSSHSSNAGELDTRTGYFGDVGAVEEADDVVPGQITPTISPSAHSRLLSANENSSSGDHLTKSSRSNLSVPFSSVSGSEVNGDSGAPSKRRIHDKNRDSLDKSQLDSSSEHNLKQTPKHRQSLSASAQSSGGSRNVDSGASSPSFSNTAKSFNTKNSLPAGEDGLELSTSTQDVDYYSWVGKTDLSLPLPQDCSLKLIIEESSPQVISQGDGEERGAGQSAVAQGEEGPRRPQPQIICWQPGWEREGRAPLVYRYSAPIKITYLWANNKPSGFSLQFSFLKLDEVECHFQCSTTPHLCLVQQQLCDGYSDCPDHSDERPHVCDSALSQDSNGKGTKVSNVIVAGVVLPCSFVIVVVVVVVLMIKHKQFGHAARRSGDSLLSPAPSQSSEACRSSQDSGQHEALLPERPPPYTQLSHQPDHHSQQHQHLLTDSSGSSDVNSLQTVQQHTQPHQPQYKQIQHCNNNSSGNNNINNNDLAGAVSFQDHQLPQQALHHQQQQHQQQQQHMLHQQLSPSVDGCNHQGSLNVPQPSSSTLVFMGSGLNTASPHGAMTGYQHHLYNNPLSNNDNDEDNNSRHHLHQQLYPNQHHYHQQQQQQQHQKQHQKNQSHKRQAKVAQPVTSPVSPTVSVQAPAQQSISVTCPPHIPVSLDGEEGYSAAQRALHSKRQMEQNLEAEYGLFRAPPNRSALERDSPPPPYSLQPPSNSGLSLDSLLSGSFFSSSCPTSFSNSSSSQSPGSRRGGNRGRGRGHSHSNSSPYNCASSAPSSRH
ncbi:hypothetical protein PoB_000167500 [Plakobranchus ocellatus]|uniref:CUB domain-containing protein n=1 Tax=Plakobranchus ocellatus TaxID=259542 RepID=A0AAV3XWJ4_9GAST|nr:hypothetical protein PoB_000167500 [Plakobranchus ocellatus]